MKSKVSARQVPGHPTVANITPPVDHVGILAKWNHKDNKPVRDSEAKDASDHLHARLVMHFSEVEAHTVDLEFQGRVVRPAVAGILSNARDEYRDRGPGAEVARLKEKVRQLEARLR